MAARLSASPLISYAALIPLLSRRAATVRYPFPFSGRSLLSFSSKTLTVARDATAMDVSARARRGFASQVDDFASRKFFLLLSWCQRFHFSVPLTSLMRSGIRVVADDLCFEAPLKIVEYPDPILRARNKRISTFDENLKKLAKEMFDVMYKYVRLFMVWLNAWKINFFGMMSLAYRPRYKHRCLDCFLNMVAGIIFYITNLARI